MATRSIETLMEDIRLLSETNHAIVEAVRAIVKQRLQGCTEEVKYGGILFSAGLPLCGVFAYRTHVSVEFGHGARICDPFGQLEGSGKGRRHLKLRSVEDIEHKHLAQYLPLALQAARAA